MTLARGYYNDGADLAPVDEVVFVSGRKAGNYYYNPWADEPRWTSITIETVISCPPSGARQTSPPEGVPRAPGDRR